MFKTLYTWKGIAGVSSGLFLISTLAYANNFYSRAECTFSGDGSAYECGASDGAPGAWNTLAVDPSLQGMGAGDTWYVCGYFGLDKRRNATNFIDANVGGLSGSPMRYTGDCSGSGGPGYAILDGEQNGYIADAQMGVKHGIQLTARSSYATLDHFEIRNIFSVPNKGNGITFPGGLGDGPIGLNILNNKIMNVGGQGIVTAGSDLKVIGNQVEQVGNDGIYVANGYQGGTFGSALGVSFGEIRDNLVADVSRNGLGSGDGIKIQNCTNVTGSQYCHFVVTGNTVYKTGSNKAAINIHGSGNGAVVSYNRLYGFSRLTLDEVGPVNLAALGAGAGSGDCSTASVSCLAEKSSGITIDGCGASQASGITEGIPELIVSHNTIENFEELGITFTAILNTGINGSCYIRVSSNSIRDIKKSAIRINYPFPGMSFDVTDNELGDRGNVLIGIEVESNTQAGNLTAHRNIVSAEKYYFELPSDVEISGWVSDWNIFDASTSANFMQSPDEFSFDQWQTLQLLDTNSLSVDFSEKFNLPVSYFWSMTLMAVLIFIALVSKKMFR